MPRLGVSWIAPGLMMMVAKIRKKPATTIAAIAGCPYWMTEPVSISLACQSRAWLALSDEMRSRSVSCFSRSTSVCACARIC